MTSEIFIRVANESNTQHVKTIVNEIESSAKNSSSGICRRSPELITKKIKEGNAIIALTIKNEWVGFCYLQAWDNNRFISTHSLIVAAQYRQGNIAKRMKEKIFSLAMQKYPEAILFGLTTSLSVMKINTRLGYRPVTFSEITQNEDFWESCKSCTNHDILVSKNKKNCLCTAMVFEPSTTNT